MAAAIIISSITITGILAALVKDFDTQGPEMFKNKDDDKED